MRLRVVTYDAADVAERAADTLTHGPHSTWGEHEIDYLLLVRLAGSADELRMEPNAEEVMDVR